MVSPRGSTIAPHPPLPLEPRILPEFFPSEIGPWRVLGAREAPSGARKTGHLHSSARNLARQGRPGANTMSWRSRFACDGTPPRLHPPTVCASHYAQHKLRVTQFRLSTQPASRASYCLPRPSMPTTSRVTHETRERARVAELRARRPSTRSPTAHRSSSFGIIRNWVRWVRYCLSRAGHHAPARSCAQGYLPWAIAKRRSAH